MKEMWTTQWNETILLNIDTVIRGSLFGFIHREMLYSLCMKFQFELKILKINLNILLAYEFLSRLNSEIENNVIN